MPELGAIEGIRRAGDPVTVTGALVPWTVWPSPASLSRLSDPPLPTLILLLLFLDPCDPSEAILRVRWAIKPLTT